MFTVTYCTSQIVVVLAYAVLGLGFRKEKKIQILTFSNIYHLLMILHYLLLSGITGLIASFIAILRNSIYIYNEKKNKSNSIWILYLFCIIAIISTFFLYTSIVDIFPCILTLIGIYSYWCGGTKAIRIGNLLISLCYIIYGFSLNSFLSVFCELYIIINTIIGYFKYEYKINNRKSYIGI